MVLLQQKDYNLIAIVRVTVTLKTNKEANEFFLLDIAYSVLKQYVTQCPAFSWFICLFSFTVWFFLYWSLTTLHYMQKWRDHEVWMKRG